MSVDFGRLESINLRDAWEHEANDFTPWLSENLDRLSEVIGIPLELEGTEAQVEQFSADIHARNPIDDSAVLIENQLEGSDHTHLGQILTYLAGLEARTVIWVAKEFQQAHQSAIRWLNDNTGDEYAFFAVQVKAYLVGGLSKSPVIPAFEVLERPNEWDRQVRAMSKDRRGGLSELAQFCQDFWAYYRERYPEDGVAPSRKGTNVYHPVAEARLHICQYIARSEGVVGIYVTESWKSDTKESVVARAELYRVPLLEELGIENLPGSIRTAYKGEIDPGDRNNWDRATEWLHDNLTIYRNVLLEVSRKINLNEGRGLGVESRSLRPKPLHLGRRQAPDNSHIS